MTLKVTVVLSVFARADDAYAGFRPGLYIVVVASDAKGGQIATDALGRESNWL